MPALLQAAVESVVAFLAKDPLSMNSQLPDHPKIVAARTALADAAAAQAAPQAAAQAVPAGPAPAPAAAAAAGSSEDPSSSPVAAGPHTGHAAEPEPVAAAAPPAA